MEKLPIPNDPDPYKVTSSKLLFDSPWIRLREDIFTHRNGAKGRYSICGFRRTACGVLALDEDDNVVLVGQWRHPLKCYSWEIIEGGGMEDETPFDTIKRELAEEAGLQASLWEPLLYSNLSNSSTDEEAFLFVAKDLSPAPEGAHPDDEEELAVMREPFQNCIQRVFTGEIADGLTLIALLAEHAKRAGKKSLMEPDLTERFFQTPANHPSNGRIQWDSAK
ncbi:MAG: NUDIX hydrolase [Holophagales bacterium]|jgi:8-oxo-dGTP pyrophosphatase MutT (NUDIX family)|nr:NUDIX hydrolase [Holophagales bacterium]